MLCTGLRSVLSEYFPEKTKPSEKRKANQNHPKKAQRQKKESPETHQKRRKGHPNCRPRGPLRKNHEPSVAMEDDLAILKLDR